MTLVAAAAAAAKLTAGAPVAHLEGKGEATLARLLAVSAGLAAMGALTVRSCSGKGHA